MARVRLQVIRHLVFRGEARRRRRKFRPWQTAMARGSEEAEGIPPVPPLLADAFLSLEHDGAHASTHQLESGGEAGLPPTDHNRLQLLDFAHFQPSDSVLMYSVQYYCSQCGCTVCDWDDGSQCGSGSPSPAPGAGDASRD